MTISKNLMTPSMEIWIRNICRSVVREELRNAMASAAPNTADVTLLVEAPAPVAVPPTLEVSIRQALTSIVREELGQTPPQGDDFFSQIFEMAPLSGDYVEFGVFRGASLTKAFFACRDWVRRLESGRIDHLVSDPRQVRERVTQLWQKRRFWGFDSFEGMPEPEGVDRERVVWQKGTFASPLDTLWQKLADAGVDLDKVVAIKGFFADALTESRRRELGIEKVAVAHVDSDLYESAKLALAFVTPALQNGTVIVFEEWFAYRGHPLQGEQRAFGEWRAENVDWLVTDYHSAGVAAKAFIVNHRSRRTEFRDRLAEITE